MQVKTERQGLSACGLQLNEPRSLNSALHFVSRAATRASGLRLALARTEAVWCGWARCLGSRSGKRPTAAVPQLLAGQRSCFSCVLLLSRSAWLLELKDAFAYHLQYLLVWFWVVFSFIYLFLLCILFIHSGKGVKPPSALSGGSDASLLTLWNTLACKFTTSALLAVCSRWREGFAVNPVPH